jgi:competence protein ComEC
VLSVVRPIGISYAVTGLLFLVTAPLVASWVHIISPSGVVIGPPMVLLTSLAIIAGFLMLVAELLGGFATPVIAMVLRWLLTACDKVVLWGDQLPLGHRYVSDIPMWWLWGLYLGLFALLWIKPIWDRRRWLGLCGAAWLCVGLLSGSLQPAPDELRCTFLSVGHGGCTILETPDGRTILYDAGSLAGPDVTQRFIAPYLWHRGTRRIDEVILSHADLDHFNALPSLLDRFSVGLVTFTPSFTAKASPGVQATMQALSTKGVPTRVVSAGDVLNAGQVRMEVLHPPAIGPDGIENVRSLVLRVRHAGHSILLTGDLQEPALSQVMARKTEPIDVLMAPHHGSRTSNTPALAKWANPRLVVICQSAPRSTSPASDPYAIAGARVMSTWRDGAVTISSHSTGLIAEGFRGGERVVVRHGSSRPQKE